MKRILRFGLALSLAATLTSCGDPLAEGFATPPSDIQTSVYWYWIQGNVSKEGVIADLHSMKKAGINRAFIGNIGLGDWEPRPLKGDVEILSKEWFEITHTAMKTATELGIDIGLFNSPGWSQAGGPWVKPEQAMRYLHTQRAEVKGGGEVRLNMAPTVPNFQPVRTLAFPAPKGVTRLDVATARITGPNGYQSGFDGDLSTGFGLQNGVVATLEIKPNKPFTLRSIRLHTTHAQFFSMAELQAVDGGVVRKLVEFPIIRVHGGREVGFDPFAPITVSCDPTSAESYRVVIHNPNPGAGIAELELSDIPLVERYPEKSLAKMHQSELPLWGDYMWPEASAKQLSDNSLAVDPESVIDISDKMQGDELVWQAPQGDWIVLRTGMTPTGVHNGPSQPQDMGLEIDKWSSKHLNSHYDAFVGRLLDSIPAADRKAWKVIVADSYERGGQNFTDDYFEYFQANFGYDPKPYLPVLSGVVVGDRDRSDRFLWDVRRMMADRLSYDHIGALRQRAHSDGLTTWLENYGHWGFPGEFLQYGGQSDEVGGEFWSEGKLGDIENRAASSCAHIYGKTKVSSESFTCGGSPYVRHPAMLKQRGDRFFSEGINNTLMHVYITQPKGGPKPGNNAWFGTEFNRNNTWFSQIDLFTNYLKRCNFMLQQGLNVADVAYFIGEDAPKMTGETNPALPAGYQFDYINAEVIVRDLSVRDGLLTLPHGTQYRMMVLPAQTTMRPEVAIKIEELVKAGAVILGAAPVHSPSLKNYPVADDQVKQVAARVWGSEPMDKPQRVNRYGKGMVLSNHTMEQALALLELTPDCRFDAGLPLMYGHRIDGDEHIYFITNQSQEAVEFTTTLRVKGLQPEWWSPTSGAMRDLKAYRQSDNGVEIALRLEPLECGFVVLRHKAKGDGVGDIRTNFPQAEVVAVPTKSWNVSFEGDGQGLFERQIDKLEDWAKSHEDTVRYFSGTARYTNQITLPAIQSGTNLTLNLGRVAVMARVKINGFDAGGVWTPPYAVDVTKLVKEGENKIEIEVVNTWVNRLIGDSRLPESVRTTFASVNPYNPQSGLQESGLLGPVCIEQRKY